MLNGDLTFIAVDGLRSDGNFGRVRGCCFETFVASRYGGNQ
jgi:hypothetical protein